MIFKHLFLTRRFFLIYLALLLVSLPVYYVKNLYVGMLVIWSLFLLISIIDAIYIYFSSYKLSVERELAEVFSLGSEHTISLSIKNESKNSLKIDIVDELPVQYQIRDHLLKTELKGGEIKVLKYKLRPTERGEYHFGHVILFLFSPLGFFRYRIKTGKPTINRVYPSVLDIKNSGLFMRHMRVMKEGNRAMRRVGSSYEFGQIKEYVRGDDIRHLNWKSTARNRQLMVNQYIEEKSQVVYNVIDKSRVMYMPFNGMSLLDYSINASLLISKAALNKDDKPGLITFSDKFGSVVKADRKPGQLMKIHEALFAQKERVTEANYELLYNGINSMVKTRSLFILYTNFESIYSMQRVLPVLRKINKKHLLLMVFFENTELENYSRKPAHNLKELYSGIVAEMAVADQHAIVNELSSHGIQCLLTQPENLSINTLNRYLSLKAKAMI